MPYLVLPEPRPGTPRPRRPWRGGAFRRRFAFLGAALKLGGGGLWAVLNVLGVAVGVTVAWILTRLADWDWSWAITAGLAVLLLIIWEGSYRMWDAADKAATYFRPTWELLQDRADILRAL